MKIGFLLAVASLSVTVVGRAQSLPSVQQTNSSGLDTPYTLTSSSANACVYQRTVYTQSATGQWVPQIQSYTELGTGLCYQQNGQWVYSVEEIDPAAGGGGQAIQGQFQAYFPYDIYSGVIQIVTPSGEQIQTRPIGLSYFDGTNSVLISELTNSIGVISGNEVVYTNVLTDFPADLVLKYRRDGLQCDLIFRSQIPAPERFGLCSSNLSTRLELLTEFFNTPPPNEVATTVDPSSGLTDSTLDFGSSMTMVRGSAFKIGPEDQDSGDGIAHIPVSKTWIPNLSGRTILVEELPYEQIQPALQSLPPLSGSNAVASLTSSLHRISASRLLPARHLAQASTNTMRVASVALAEKPGVLWDYNIINSTLTNFTFQGDSTYLINGSVDLFGTNTFEGAVLKYGLGASVTLESGSAVNWLSTAYSPIIFTAKDDDAVGQRILTSTGNPTTNYYGNPALAINNGAGIQNFRILHASIAVQSGTSTLGLTNGQIVDCNDGLYARYYFANNSWNLENMLIANVQCIFLVLNNTNNWTISLQHTTLANSLYLALPPDGGPNYDWPFFFNFTNCILADVTNSGGLTFPSDWCNGVNNGFYNVFTNVVPKFRYFGANRTTNTVYPFQTVGGGSYYLTNGCIFRQAGTTNIDPNLLADIVTETTYPPFVYSGTNISSLASLSPIVARDTNSSPDLGYHYCVLDYAFGGCDLYSNLAVAAGTCVGWYQLTGAVASASQPYGISLNNGANLSFNGNVTQPCFFANYSTVQEGNGNWTNSGSMGGIMFNGTNSTQAPQLSANFTKWTMNGTNNFFCDNAAYGSGSFKNCEFYDGNISTYGMQNLTFSNCLFFRDDISFWDPDFALSFDFGNCTFYNGCLAMMRTNGEAASFWQVENCAFDGTAFAWSDNYSGSSAHTLFNYNAYNTNNLSWQAYPYPYPPTTNTLEVVGPKDLMVSNYDWETSWFGNFYLPPNSPLIRMGSTNANLLGLYHFTTQTNQTIEGTNIVDMGYHYVATYDTNGLPLDFTGDGTPDYLADSNGDGIYDAGDLADWLLGIDSQPQSQNVVQGTNVTFSVTAGGSTPFYYQWMFNGANISGATSSNLTLLVVTTNNEGNYTVVVTNSSNGAVTSSVAILAVDAPLGIVSGPTNATALQEGTTNFGATISGSHPVFQWYTNGGPVNNSRISGATTADMTISSIVGSDAGNYYVVATNLFNCVTSSPAMLTVITNPDLLAPPGNLTNDQGNDVTLTVGVSGVDLFYQWWLTNSLGTNAISGATNSAYNKLVVQTNDAGEYCVVITNLAGSTNASGSLTVLVPPWFTNQPASVTNSADGNATFGVTAFGTTNLSYQWFKNGTNQLTNTGNVSGATSNVLTLTDIQISDAAGYFLVVSNIAGTNATAWAWLCVVSNGITYNGWGPGNQPPTNAPVVSMISPTNLFATNPAIYLAPTNISIRASATSPYDYITNVVLYDITNSGASLYTNSLGSAVRGTNASFAIAWNNAPHGTNLLLAVAKDNLGLSATSSNVYVIVDWAPTNSAGLPQTLAWTTNTTNMTLQMAGVVTDDGLPFGVTNVLWSLLSGNGHVTFTPSNVTNAQAKFTNYGTYVLQLQADDDFATNDSSCTIILDVPPFISITSPASNSVIVTGTPFVLSANAYGLSSTVTNVEFYTNSGPLGAATPTLGNNYNFAWTNAPLWTNYVSAVAEDNYGLYATSTVSVVVVPYMADWIVSPTNGQLFVDSPTNVILTAFVTNFIGASNTSVSFSNQFVNLGQATYLGNSLWQLWWGATNGTYTITVTAKDNAGDTATNSVGITVNAMPIVTVTSPTNLQSFLEVANVTNTVTASDSDGSVTNVTLYGFGTNNIWSTNFPPYTSSATFGFVWSNLVATNYPVNYYPVTAVATDNRGASSVSQIVIFEVTPTNPIPSIFVSYPTNNASFSDGSDITITAVTNGAGSVRNVEFFVDGQSIGSDPDAPYEITKCCWKPGSYTIAAVATDSNGVTVASTNINIIILPDSANNGGFWDAVYGNATEQGYLIPAFGTYDYWSGVVYSIAAGPEEGEIFQGSGNEEVYNTLVRSSNSLDWIIAPLDNDSIGDPYTFLPAMTSSGTNVYVGGLVDVLGSNTNYVAQWNGTGWTPVGNQFNGGNWGSGIVPTGGIWCLAVIGGDLYAGGEFTSTGVTNIDEDTNAQRIARLDPVSGKWAPVGNGITNGCVLAIAAVGNDIYIGGSFTNAGGNPNANYIARLVGDTWTNVGPGVAGINGVDGTVTCMAACNTNLFVGGFFSIAGNDTNVNGVAMWNTVNWQSLGGGIAPLSDATDYSPGKEIPELLPTEMGTNYVSTFAPDVLALAVRGDTVYVGGWFAQVYNGSTVINAQNIAEAQWSEASQTWTWSDLDKGVWYLDDPDPGLTVPEGVLRLVIVPSQTNGAYDLYVGGAFEDVGSAPNPSRFIARWRVGYPPAPSLPTVTITNPPNETVYSNLPPSSIEIDAVALSTYTNIANVQFFVDGQSIGNGSTSDYTNYTTTWSPAVGPHVFTAVATDGAGLNNKSKPVLINIIDTNNTVTALDDLYVFPVNGPPAVLNVLTNDSTTTGNPLHVVAVFPGSASPPLGTPTVSFDGKSILYTITPNAYGTDQFIYWVTDGVSTNQAYVTIKLRTQPIIAFQDPSDGSQNDAGVNLVADGAMVDEDSTLTNFSVYVNGTLLAEYIPTNINYLLNPTNFFFDFPVSAVSPQTSYAFFSIPWSNNTAGFYTFTASAVDADGFSNTSASVTLAITNNSTATDVLTANISNLAISETPQLGTINYTTVTNGFFDLHGTASDSHMGNLVSYQILVHPFENDGVILANVTPPQLDASGFHDGAVVSGDLGVCDFSTLANGIYDLELIVRGGGGETNTIVPFQLQSNLKIGQFSFSEQDLVLPVNGIPITVTRAYNSLNPLSSDFGYSWSFTINSMDVQLDEQRQDVTIGGNQAPIGGGGGGNGPPPTVSVRTGGGRDVTLTLPDGRRVTFQCYFQPAGVSYDPYWQAPPGVNYDLEPVGNPHYDDLFGLVAEWNGVENLSFDVYDVQGWTLTSKTDGTQYSITRQGTSVYYDTTGSGNYAEFEAYGPPQLTQIKQVSGDTIVISSNSIAHYNPSNQVTRAVSIQRDAQGRIVAVYDPNSGTNGFPALQYVYDQDTGNLIQALKIMDRNNGIYTTNKYDYNNPNFPHYITSVENGDDIPVARNYYDDSGRLIEEDDADGDKTLFNHSTTNNTDIVVDRLGYTNTYLYDLLGNVIAQTNGLGQVTTMAYDGNNNKTNQVSYLNGAPYATNSYNYDPVTSLLLSSTDPLGHTTTSAYNSFGEVTDSIDANGNPTINHYDNDGNLTSIVDALGNTKANFYNNSLLVASRDPDGTLTTNFYDSGENLIAAATYSTSGTILTTNTYGYDLNGNRTNATAWRRVNSSWTGAATTYIYDGQNRVMQTIDSDAGTNTIAYNADGTQQSTTDALGRTTSYVYDDLQRLIQTIYPDGTTTQSSYDANGNQTSSVDQATNVTIYVYDALNRPTQTIYADNTTNTTVYDSVGRIAKTIDARGGITAYDYDAAGRQLALTNAFGTSAQMLSQYIYDANGNQIVFIDANNHCTTNVFDKLNRQVQVMYADGTSTSTEFDGAGRNVAQTNQDGIVTLFGYDGAARLTAVTNALGTAQQIVTRYQYDETANETAQIDALNRTNLFAYDNMGRRISHTMPGSQTEGFAYDCAGNLVYHTNFNGVIITNKYDSLNRFTSRSSVFGYNVTFAYSSTGQRTNMTDPSGSTAYLYDTRNRLTNKLVSFTGGPSVTIRYGYDANGNVTNITSSTTGGVNLAYSYDPLNRLTNVLAGGSAAASYGFDAVGNLQAVRYGTLATNSYQYDSLNRLTTLTCTTVSGIVASFNYRLGLTGNRTNLTETVNGTSRTNQWQYDRLYRLTNEVIIGSGAGTVGYGLDAVGNRTSRTVSGFGGVAGMTNQSPTYNTNDWLNNDTYDSNGNTTASWGNSYLYDALNHVTNATVGGMSVVMTYDGDGNRVKKAVGATTTYYLVDDRNPNGYAQVLEEYSGTTLSRVYDYGLDLISQNTGGTVYYFGYDGHGSTRYVLTSSGTIQESYAYDAYGIMIAGPSTPSTAYLYCGQQYDFNLGLYYNRARYLNPGTGSFWTADSYEGDNEDPQSLHKYVYCGNDPNDGIDPTGNDIESDSGQLGIKAHRVFSYYCAITRGIPGFPGLTLKTILPQFFKPNTPGANQKPDLVDLSDDVYYELKPISHQANVDFQEIDAAKMRVYDYYLNPLQIYRGNSMGFVAPGTLAGSFTDGDIEYAVYLYPEFAKTSAGYNGKGLIYYDLVPLKGPSDPVRQFLEFFEENPLVGVIPIGFRVARPVTLPVGQLVKSQALARTVPPLGQEEVEDELEVDAVGGAL